MELSLQDKIDLLSGELPFYTGAGLMLKGYGSRPWVAARSEKLGLDGVLFVDGPRGIVMKGGTTFPVPICRGATFDVELEQQIGEAISTELVSLGGTTFGGVCVNLLRHPSWGRAQETFGEDTLLLSEMGGASCRGVEKYGMAVVKHFALNSMENARFRVNVKIEERDLHEVYLRHFERIVKEAKPSFVMSAYNQCNGEYCGESYTLLTEILRQKWGFEGAVMTDFVFGLRDARKALLAGQDLEMPFRQTFHRNLPQLVNDPEVTRQIGVAVDRLIRVQRLNQSKPKPRAVDVNKHAELSLDAARRGIVLLQNRDSLLPLPPSTSIALFGRKELVSFANLGDRGSSNTLPSHVVTCEDGIRDSFPTSLVRHSFDEQMAKASQACVVVVGYTFKDEGEFVVPNLDPREVKLFPPPSIWDVPALLQLAWMKLSGWMFGANESTMMGVGGDRVSLELRDEDVELISQVSRANPNTVVVVMTGSAFTCETWREKVKGLVVLWYPGERGGQALGEVLTGRVNPSGHLPLTLPQSYDHLPFFNRDAEEIEYGFFHGWRKLQHDGIRAAFPFGFGLSYTRFALSNPLALEEDELAFSVKAQNVGDVVGDMVIQVYASAIGSVVEKRAPKELVAFVRVRELQPQEIRVVEVRFPEDRLAYYDIGLHHFVVEACAYEICFAQSSDDEAAVSTRVTRFLVKGALSRI